MDTLNSLWEQFLTDRGWSWTLLGSIYLIITFIVRSIFFKPILRHAKLLQPKQYKKIKIAYLKKSFSGWLFYFLSFFMIVSIWYVGFQAGFSINDLIVAFIAIISFLLSVIFHLGAFTNASLEIFKKIETNQLSQ